MAKKKASKQGRSKRPSRSGPRSSGGAPEFDHLFLGTADFGKAWGFWRQVVGLEGLSKWGSPKYAGSVRLGGGSITLAQGEEGPHEELGYVVANGKPQLYLRTSDVDKLHAQVAKRGAKVLRAPLTTHYGARGFSVEGPDGMVVVFSEER